MSLDRPFEAFGCRAGDTGHFRARRIAQNAGGLPSRAVLAAWPGRLGPQWRSASLIGRWGRGGFAWRRHPGRVGAGVGVAPFASAAPHEGDARFPEGLLFRVGFDLVTDEGCNFPVVEVGEQDRNNDLGGAESANAATAGRFDVLGSATFNLIVEGLDGVAGMSVKFVPFLRAVFKGLSISPVLRGIEGHGVLAVGGHDKLGGF